MTTLSDARIQEISNSIVGWLDPNEAKLLYQLALEIPDGGTVVEVGSYQGRSTAILALGAQERNGKVVAVDHYNGNGKDLVVTPNDLNAIKANLAKYDLTDTVEVVVSDSLAHAKDYSGGIDLLFLDGSHQYADVLADLEAWGEQVDGKIAMHDTSGNWPGVSQALNEFLASGKWVAVNHVDSITVLQKFGDKVTYAQPPAAEPADISLTSADPRGVGQPVTQLAQPVAHEEANAPTSADPRGDTHGAVYPGAEAAEHYGSTSEKQSRSASESQSTTQPESLPKGPHSISATDQGEAQPAEYKPSGVKPTGVGDNTIVDAPMPSAPKQPKKSS
jgi:hypothetical protein